MTTRGPGFSDEEVTALLDIIDEILPNSPNSWERVAVSHRNLFPDLKQNTKSLKRKFESLYNHKKPTGDPTCPVAVRKAKQIWEEIKSRMDFLDAEGELDLHVNVAPHVFAKEVAETAPTAALQAGVPEEVEPIVTEVAAPPRFRVVTVLFSRLNVVAEDVTSPPLTARSPAMVRVSVDAL